MQTNLKNYISEWEDWIASEKRLSINTIDSYKIDLRLFLDFLSEHFNKDITLEDLINLEEKESKIAKKLSDKYGKVSIDIETGTFIPAK